MTKVTAQKVSNLEAARQEIQEALLDLFAVATQMPIGLYEQKNGEMKATFSELALAKFEPHCRLIQQFPGGRELCERDQCNRARTALSSLSEQITLCHAGMYNQAVPVIVKGETRAVLLYGEMQIADDTYKQQAIARHEEAVARLGLGESDAHELRNLLLSAKSYSPQQLEALKRVIPRVERGIYSFMDHEDQLKRSFDKVTHEIQTRLQAVIAISENLALEANSMTSEEIREMSNDLLYSALALDTVVQSHGDYLAEYHFQDQFLAPLIYESRRIYQAEAKRRGIVIRIALEKLNDEKPKLEVSKHHLQYALNNLLHNAIKYSFRGGPGRERHVSITGSAGEDYYKISVENFGIGILPREIEGGLIFEDGYQGELTQGEYRTGAGRGLHLINRVIARHHGKIDVVSRLVSGQSDPEGQPHITQFAVLLPYKQPKKG